MQQRLFIKNRIHRKLKNQPITYGVCWPEGVIPDENNIGIFDENDRQIPAGVTVLNRWKDDSLQWTLLDFNVDVDESASRTLIVKTKVIPHTKTKNPVSVERKNDTIILGNGLVRIVLSSKKGVIVEKWDANGIDIIKPNGFDVYFKNPQGKRFSAKKGNHTISIEHQNPLRAVVRIDGKHQADDKTEMLDYFLRFEIFADREDTKITYCFRNRELPTPGIKIKSFYIECKTATGEKTKKCFAAKNLTRYYKPGFLRIDEDVCIVASDNDKLDYGDDHQRGKVGFVFVKDGKILHDPEEEKPWFMRNVKYRMSVGNRLVFPYICLAGKTTCILSAFNQMNTLHPKEIKTKNNIILFGIFPNWAKTLSITQGAGRSHTIFITPLKPDVSDMEIQDRYLSWEVPMMSRWTPQSPVEISCDIEHIRKSKVFAIDMLPEYDMKNRPLFEKKILDSWIGISYGTLGWTEEVIPMLPIGFWDYGDNGANNEEMFGLVYFQNYFRSGNWTCAENGIAIARHILEVDFVDFSIDPLQNGGMVAHCLNHNNGAVYPSHMWFTELLFAYVLTGDKEFKQAAIRICKNLLQWIEKYFWIISADHRESGQPMINLTWTYEFNRDEKYLKACEKIIKENLMKQAKKYGRMFVPKPHSMPIKLVRYGDYATWEGCFWYWKITKDEEVKNFMLSQLEWRLSTEFMTSFAYHRVSDINPAAYAYYMTGDRIWIDRIAKYIKAAFRCAKWPIGWIHSMYTLKIAFELDIIKDDDIIPQ